MLQRGSLLHYSSNLLPSSAAVLLHRFSLRDALYKGGAHDVLFLTFLHSLPEA